MAEFDDLDGLDDLGDLEEISFEDTNPVLPGQQMAPPQPAAPQPGAPQPGAPQPAAPQPGAPQPAAAAPPTGGLGAVIYDLISKRNYQQVIQIAESQRSAIEQDPQAKALVENAKAQLQKEAQIKSYVEGARQAMAAGQAPQAEAYLAKAREIDPSHPDVLAMASAPQPAAPAPAPAPAPDAFAMPAPGGDDMLSFDEAGSLPDLSFPDSDPAPQPGAPQPGAPAPAPAPDAFAMPAPGAPQPAASAPAPDAFAMPAPGAPQPAAPAPADFPPADFGSGDDFGDLSLDPGSLPEGFEPAGLDAPAAAPAPAPGGEGAERIPALIEEGKAQFQQGQYQAAIDTWSRIFLIDIDHAEASQLIEQAQSKKAEIERQAEEVFHGAVEQIEQQQLEEAKASLARVLELQPGHTAAKEYLDQLQAGQVPVITQSPSTGEIDLLDDGGLGSFDGSDLAAASGIETGQSMEAAVARDRVVVVKKTDKKLVGVAAVVALLVLGGGGFLALKWNDLFPNTSKPKETERKLDPIARATKMFEAGKIENAVLLLEKISAEEEDFEEAQALITQWKAQIESSAEPQSTGPPPELVKRRDLLLRAARDAHSKGHFIRARKYFDRAHKILPLDAEALQIQQDCDFQLSSLQPQIEKFQEGAYAEILPILWRKREDAPDDPNIKLLIVDSYYNLALTDLQRGNPSGAAKKLEEALEVDSGNEDLVRMKLFAETYTQRSQDLLYRIFVKYLPSRS